MRAGLWGGVAHHGATIVVLTGVTEAVEPIARPARIGSGRLSRSPGVSRGPDMGDEADVLGKQGKWHLRK